MRICVDWDGTLADKGEWLPGALQALRRLARDHTVIIHSSRANWPGGVVEIETKLAAAKLSRLEVQPKPHADLYVDNLAIPFAGDWPDVLRQIRHVIPSKRSH